MTVTEQPQTEGVQRQHPQGVERQYAQGVERQWDRIRGQLKKEFGLTAYRTWVEPISVDCGDRGGVRLSVPTRFMRDWIRNHYGDRIRSLWQEEEPVPRSIDFVVADVVAAEPAGKFAVSPVDAAVSRGAGSAPPLMPTAPTIPVAPAVPAAPTRIDGLSAPLDPRYTFENFVVGKPNEFAYAAAKRVADADVVSFNPLFLYGGVGLGKTHLMHAIARRVRENQPDRSVIYLSAEQFMHRFIRALRQQDTLSFKEQFRSVDVLMVDDIQFISGKESTQEEFFHTFNALVDQGSQIVLSADKSPTDLEQLGQRLRSRMNCGLVADLHPTTYELRLGILESKAEQMNVAVPEPVLEFIAHKITTNGREVEGALTRLVAHAQLVGRPLSIETAQDVLRDLLRAYDKRITIDEIQKKVAEHFRIRPAEMQSQRRARAVARPRQVAMYLAKQLTSRSLPDIGSAFGGRDHTTVMHAVRKVEELMGADTAFAEDVDFLRCMLDS